MKLHITNITAKRESLKMLINGVDEAWNYLTLYDQNNDVIIRSIHHAPEEDIELEYEGLIFFAPAKSIYDSNHISINFNSLKKFIGL